MTGKYPARVGVTNFIGGHSVGKLLDVPYMHHLPMNERSIATALRDGGYQTWHIGKWHLGNGLTYPKKHGFDVNIGGCGWGMPNNGYFSPWGIETMPDGPEGQYLTDAIGDAAVKQIREREIILAVTYIIVVFSIVFQGLTLKPLVKRLMAK